MSKYGNKSEKRSEFPSQTENRKQWCLDSVRNNQRIASELLSACLRDDYTTARMLLLSMYPHDSDGLTIPDGILTEDQIATIQGNDDG